MSKKRIYNIARSKNILSELLFYLFLWYTFAKQEGQMPLTQLLLLKIPIIPLGIIVVASSVALATGTILVIHYLIPHHKPNRHTNQVTMILFGAKALIYSILLALILVGAWIGFDNATVNVQKEANCLIELYRSTEAFLPGIKQETRALLEEYTKSVINDEWKTLQKSELSPRTTEIAKKIWQTYINYSPKTPTEEAFLQESIRKIAELREWRTARLTDSKTGVYPLIWLVLIAGEIATIASIAFFAEDFKSKLIMSVLFAALVGIIFFTIILFDFPYTGTLTASPEPLKQAMLYW